MELGYLNDSGAGRTIASASAFTEQGVNHKQFNQLVGPSTQSITFDTGGGAIKTNKSIGLTSNLLGTTECFQLPESPFAVSMGHLVNEQQHPFVWLPGQLPFHVTNPKHLKVSCPQRYRNYADRVEGQVPIWKETITIQPTARDSAAPNFLAGMPAEATEYTVSAKLTPHKNTRRSVQLSSSSEAVGSDTDPQPSGEPATSTNDDVVKALPADAEPEVIEADVVIPDVPLADADAHDALPPRYRSMSREALLTEAASPEHLMSHYPHNPLCDVCIRAHMRQRRFARKTERDDDELPPVKEPRKLLGADHIIISKSAVDSDRVSASGNIVAFTIRDQFSGIAVAYPMRTRSKDDNYRHLKTFVGTAGHRPDVMVRSDAASEITLAVEDLGWFSEPSLENKWPHNAVHERWIGTFKSVVRACMLQSGFPPEAWDFAVPYASIVLSVTQPTPIHPWEKDASGQTLPGSKHRETQSCWE